VGPTARAGDYCGAEEEAEVPWHLSLSYGWLASTLRFDGGVSAPFFQRSATVSLGRRLGSGFTVQAGAGAVTGGGIDVSGTSYAMQPGFLARLGATWLALDGRGSSPFVAVSAAAAVSEAATAASARPSATLTSVDLGLSASVGKALFGLVAPYVGARVFGGPVAYSLGGRSVTGTDANHWQAALGAAVSAPLGLDLLVEWAPLGARSLLLQAGVGF